MTTTNKWWPDTDDDEDDLEKPFVIRCLTKNVEQPAHT